MKQWQLAQVNIARARDELDSPLLQGFVDRLDEINTLADHAPGFVWRLQTDDGDATSIKAFDDPRLIINLSVWRDIESLKTFVYKTTHLELIRARSEWFHKPEGVFQAMWWIAARHQPDLHEAKSRLQYLEENGASVQAFTFSKPHPAPTGN
jgi:hypothetical protein